MSQIEIVARSEAQALEKAALALKLSVDDIHVIEEYEPDELDIENLDKEEANNPTLKTVEGEATLYIVKVSQKKLIEEIRTWVQGMVELFQPGSTCTVKPRGEGFLAIIEAEDPSIFIGKQGQTLQALQHVVSRVLPTKLENCPPVHLDVGDYRDKRLAQLERIAENSVQRALRTRRNVELRPMSSQDRKYIHNYLKNYPEITTQSFGNEPHRYLVIEVPGGQRQRGGGGGGRRGGGKPNQRGSGGRQGGGNRQRGGGGGNKDHQRSSGGGRGGERYQQRSDAALLDNRPNGGSQQRSGGSHQPPPPSFDDYQDINIEERVSRLPVYNEKTVDDSVFDPERPMVDELE